MKPKTVAFPLTVLEIQQLNRMFTESKTLNPGADIVSRWFQSVVRFLEVKGFEIVTNELRDSEHRLMANAATSRAYMSELIKVVNPNPEYTTPEQRTMLYLTASPEDRAAAVERLWSKAQK